MINVILPDGRNTIKEEKEIAREFISSKGYNICKGGFCSNPQTFIKEWVADRYIVNDESQLNSLLYEIYRVV